jgi:ubiquinone biosynthesis protein
MRLLAIALTGVLIVLSVVGTPGGPAVTTTVGLYQLLGYNLLVVSRHPGPPGLVLIFRPERRPAPGLGSPCLLQYASAN